LNGFIKNRINALQVEPVSKGQYVPGVFRRRGVDPGDQPACRDGSIGIVGSPAYRIIVKDPDPLICGRVKIEQGNQGGVSPQIQGGAIVIPELQPVVFILIGDPNIEIIENDPGTEYD